jgi:hypothetical protein
MTYEGKRLAYGTKGVFHGSRLDSSTAGRYFSGMVTAGIQLLDRHGIVNGEKKFIHVEGDTEVAPMMPSGIGLFCSTRRDACGDILRNILEVSEELIMLAGGAIAKMSVVGSVY